MAIALATPPRNGPALSQLERDEEGFLLDAHDWHPDLIDAFAAEDELEMTAERHEVVDYIRSYFEKNLSVPEARTLLKHLQTVWDKDKATRRYLYQLFPRGYGQQACKIAGMRKPRKLMLDV
ncbi:MAG: TusE/DsrC/DsvC family sulfur relay protein [Gammaproteobacteria bacterium]|jgi:tRNA 2-thiouridine synthesizing protein E